METTCMYWVVCYSHKAFRYFALCNICARFVTRIEPLVNDFDIMACRKDMPLLAEHLHYRIVDVSTVRELARRWFPTIYNNQPRKENKHTAMSDILESIEELKYFRKKIFIKDQ